MDDSYIEVLNSLENKEKLGLRWSGEYWINEQNGVENKIKKVKEQALKNKGGDFQLLGTKLFADGTVEEGTAYLSEPYTNGNNANNHPQWSNVQAFKESILKADKEHLQIHVHAIGDAGLKLAVDAIEEAIKVNPKWDRRPAITHVQIVNDREIKRMADLGIVAIPDPVWFMKGEYFDQIEVPAFGFERASKEYPMKSFFDAGVVVASATDSIAEHLDPLFGLELAITRTDHTTDLGRNNNDKVLGPKERISLAQAIESYIINAAYSMFIDDITGSLEVGKKADIVVLNDNLFNYEDNPEDIFEKVKVSKTIFNGKIVFEKN